MLSVTGGVKLNTAVLGLIVIQKKMYDYIFHKFSLAKYCSTKRNPPGTNTTAQHDIFLRLLPFNVSMYRHHSDSLDIIIIYDNGFLVG